MQYANMTEKELLLVLTERQENHLDQHRALAVKVARIEEKIIEDIENRVRLLENDSNERRGMYKLWLITATAISVLSMAVAIYTNLTR
jgi:hypothetical protein